MTTGPLYLRIGSGRLKTALAVAGQRTAASKRCQAAEDRSEPASSSWISAPNVDNPALGADPRRTNDFNYVNDPHGRQVPFGSHMRRMKMTKCRVAPSSCCISAKVIPPILWAAAFFTSLRDFNRYRRPIGLLAIGLVLATSIAVAAAARALFPGMSWAAAVALGAIVSPPDAVAAIAIVWR